MDRVILILVTAHLLGDFILQSRSMVERKHRFSVLLLHVALLTAVTIVLLGALPLIAISVIFISHLVMDWLKIAVMTSKRGWTPIGAFTIDQAVHIGIIIGLASFFPMMADDGLWLSDGLTSAAFQQGYLAVLTLVSATILAVPVGGHVIGMLTGPLLKQVERSKIIAANAEASAHRSLTPTGGAAAAGAHHTPGNRSVHAPVTRTAVEQDIEGLRHGGRYIGWLERGLVLLLMLINQPNGVGFLIAAKSLLRFGDIRESQQRRMTEYIIIGTFLSFGWAMLVAVMAAAVLAHW